MVMWKDIDTKALLEALESLREAITSGSVAGATTSDNAGRYTVPLGAPMRREMPRPVVFDTYPQAWQSIQEYYMSKKI